MVELSGRESEVVKSVEDKLGIPYRNFDNVRENNPVKLLDMHWKGCGEGMGFNESDVVEELAEFLANFLRESVSGMDNVFCWTLVGGDINGRYIGIVHKVNEKT